jgi:hypothetical protein
MSGLPTNDASTTWWHDPLSGNVILPIEGCGRLVVSAWFYLGAAGFLAVSVSWISIALRALKRSERFHIFGDIYMILYYAAMCVFYIWWIAAYLRALITAPSMWKAYVLLDFPWLFLFVASISTLTSGGIAKPFGFGPRDLRRLMRICHPAITSIVVILHAFIPIAFTISAIAMAPSLIVAIVRWVLSLLGKIVDMSCSSNIELLIHLIDAIDVITNRYWMLLGGITWHYLFTVNVIGTMGIYWWFINIDSTNITCLLWWHRSASRTSSYRSPTIMESCRSIGSCVSCQS